MHSGSADGRVAGEQEELVLLTFSGVQAFIAQSVSTSDLRNSSEIVGELMRVVGQALGRGGTLVLPALEAPSNKLVAVHPSGAGTPALDAVRTKVDKYWRDLVASTFPGGKVEAPIGAILPWFAVVVSRRPGETARQWWQRANWELQAKKRQRLVPAGVAWVDNPTVCGLLPAWPVSRRKPPEGKLRPQHETGELSQPGWVKRSWHRVRDQERFPSTRSIASAPYRRELGRRLTDADQRHLTTLRDAVGKLRLAEKEADVLPVGQPLHGLGVWIYPESWSTDRLTEYRTIGSDDIAELAGTGQRAAGELSGRVGLTPPFTSYLAVLCQDTDSLGEALGRLEEFPTQHEKVSSLLAASAGKHDEIVREHLGRVVYSGGDDLLALLPAATALDAARALHDGTASVLAAWPARKAPTVSTAVVFFHATYPLQRAIGRAREALKQAKSRAGGRKHALAVVVLRRGGERASTVQPWQLKPYPGDQCTAAGDPAGALLTLAGAADGVTGQLGAELEGDHEPLAKLAGADSTLLRAELARRARRHNANPHAVRDMLRLAVNDPDRQPKSALLVARFLRTETG